MSIPSEGVRVLQENPATLPLSPTASSPSGPLNATVQWPNGARESLGRGRVV